MKRFYVFKDGTQQGSTATRELAVDLIRQYQELETHPILRSEFSIIEGEEEFIPYPSRQKPPRQKRGMERYGGSTLSFVDVYRNLMEKPIEEIIEDFFFRMDNFRYEPWYGEFELFLVAGICQPPEEHVPQVRKALKVMGYDTHTVSRDGGTYILPGEARQAARELKKHDDRER